MYTAEHFKISDQAEILSFMRAYSFATIITVSNNLPSATHLPFAITQEGDQLYLHSHFAKANKQWQDLDINDALVIFSEPHAYISTKHYDHEKNVPTWNYMAVHVYGKGEIITDKDAALRELDHMIAAFEKEYKAQWDSLPATYREGMLKSIVPFKMKVTSMEAKKKISQNRSITEKERIIDTLEKSTDTAAKTIADLMKKERDGKTNHQ